MSHITWVEPPVTVRLTDRSSARGCSALSVAVTCVSLQENGGVFELHLRGCGTTALHFEAAISSPSEGCGDTHRMIRGAFEPVGDSMLRSSVTVYDLSPDTLHSLQWSVFPAAPPSPRGGAALLSLTPVVLFATAPQVCVHRLCHVGDSFAELNFVRPAPQLHSAESLTQRFSSAEEEEEGGGASYIFWCGSRRPTGSLEVTYTRLERPFDSSTDLAPWRRHLIFVRRFSAADTVPWLESESNTARVTDLPHSAIVAVKVRSIDDEGRFGPYSEECFFETLVPERIDLVSVAAWNGAGVRFRLTRTQLGGGATVAPQLPPGSVLTRYATSDDGIKQRRLTVWATWDDNPHIRAALERQHTDLSRTIAAMQSVLNEIGDGDDALKTRCAEVKQLLAEHERKAAALQSALCAPDILRVERRIDTDEDVTAVGPLRHADTTFRFVYETMDGGGTWCSAAPPAQFKTPPPTITTGGAAGGGGGEVAAAAIDEKRPPTEPSLAQIHSMLSLNTCLALTFDGIEHSAAEIAWSPVDYREVAMLVHSPTSSSNAARLSALHDTDRLSTALEERGVELEYAIAVAEFEDFSVLEESAEFLREGITEPLCLFEADGDAFAAQEAAADAEVCRSADLAAAVRVYALGDGTVPTAPVHGVVPTTLQRPFKTVLTLCINSRHATVREVQYLRTAERRHRLDDLSPGRFYVVQMSQYCAIRGAWFPPSRALLICTSPIPRVVVTELFLATDASASSSTTACGRGGVVVRVPQAPMQVAEASSMNDAVALSDTNFTFSDTHVVEFSVAPLGAPPSAAVASQQSRRKSRLLSPANTPRAACTTVEGSDAMSQHVVATLREADSFTLPHIPHGAVAIRVRYRFRRWGGGLRPGPDHQGSDGHEAEGPWSPPVFTVFRYALINVLHMARDTVTVEVPWLSENDGAVLDDAQPQELLSAYRLSVQYGDDEGNVKSTEASPDARRHIISFGDSEQLTMRATVSRCFSDAGAAVADAARDWAQREVRLSLPRAPVVMPMEITDSSVDFVVAFEKMAPLSKRDTDGEGIFLSPHMPLAQQSACYSDLLLALQSQPALSRVPTRPGPFNERRWGTSRSAPRELEAQISLLPPDGDAVSSAKEVTYARLYTTGRSNTARLASLSPGSTYRVMVRSLLYRSPTNEGFFSAWSAPVTFYTAPPLELQLSAIDERTATVSWTRAHPLKGMTRRSERHRSSRRDSVGGPGGPDEFHHEYLAFLYRSILQGAFEAFVEVVQPSDSATLLSESSVYTPLALVASSSTFSASDSLSASGVLPTDATSATFAGLTPDTAYVAKVRQLRDDTLSPRLMKSVGRLYPAEEDESAYAAMAWCSHALLFRTMTPLLLTVTVLREGAASMTLRRAESPSSHEALAALAAKLGNDRDGVAIRAAAAPGSSGLPTIHLVQLRIVESKSSSIIGLSSAAPPRGTLRVLPVNPAPTAAAAIDPKTDHVSEPYLSRSVDGNTYWRSRQRKLDALASGGSDVERVGRLSPVWFRHAKAPSIPIHSTMCVLSLVQPMEDGSRIVNVNPHAAESVVTFHCRGLVSGCRYGLQFRYKSREESAMTGWSAWQFFETHAALCLRPVHIRESSVDVAWDVPETNHDNDDGDVVGYELEICGRLPRNGASAAEAWKTSQKYLIAYDGLGNPYAPAAKLLSVPHGTSNGATLDQLLSGNVYGIAVRAKFASGRCGPMSNVLFIRTLLPFVVQPLSLQESSILIKVTRQIQQGESSENKNASLKTWFDMVRYMRLHVMNPLQMDQGEEEEGEGIEAAHVVTTAGSPPLPPIEQQHDIIVQLARGGLFGDANEKNFAVAEAVVGDAAQCVYVIRHLLPDHRYRIAARSRPFKALEAGPWSKPSVVSTLARLSYSVVSVGASFVTLSMERTQTTVLADAVTRGYPVVPHPEGSTVSRYRLCCCSAGSVEIDIPPSIAAQKRRFFSDVRVGASRRDYVRCTVVGLQASSVYGIACRPIMDVDPALVEALGPSLAEKLCWGDPPRLLGNICTAPHTPPPPRLYECSSGCISLMWNFEGGSNDNDMDDECRRAVVTTHQSRLSHESAEHVRTIQSTLEESRVDLLGPAEAWYVAGENLSQSLILCRDSQCNLATPVPLDAVEFEVQAAHIRFPPTVEGANHMIQRGPFVSCGTVPIPFARCRLHPTQARSFVNYARSTVFRVGAILKTHNGEVVRSAWSHWVRPAPLPPLGPPAQFAVRVLSAAAAKYAAVDVVWRWPDSTAAHNQVHLTVELQRNDTRLMFDVEEEWETAARVAFPACRVRLRELYWNEAYRVRAFVTSTYGAGPRSITVLFATPVTRGSLAAAPIGTVSDGECSGGVIDPSAYSVPFPIDTAFDATPPPCETPFHGKHQKNVSASRAAELVLPTLSDSQQVDEIPLHRSCSLPRDRASIPRPPSDRPLRRRRDVLALRSAQRRTQTIGSLGTTVEQGRPTTTTDSKRKKNTLLVVP